MLIQYNVIIMTGYLNDALKMFEISKNEHMLKEFEGLCKTIHEKFHDKVLIFI